ncbi:MAG TPA: hypothetical protein VIS56_01425 [Candidatus Saccharimonadales bacterium]
MDSWSGHSGTVLTPPELLEQVFKTYDALEELATTKGNRLATTALDFVGSLCSYVNGLEPEAKCTFAKAVYGAACVDVSLFREALANDEISQDSYKQAIDDLLFVMALACQVSDSIRPLAPRMGSLTLGPFIPPSATYGTSPN